MRDIEHTDHKRSKHQNATSNTTTRTRMRTQQGPGPGPVDSLRRREEQQRKYVHPQMNELSLDRCRTRQRTASAFQITANLPSTRPDRRDLSDARYTKQKSIENPSKYSILARLQLESREGTLTFCAGVVGLIKLVLRCFQRSRTFERS